MKLPKKRFIAIPVVIASAFGAGVIALQPNEGMINYCIEREQKLEAGITSDKVFEQEVGASSEENKKCDKILADYQRDLNQ